jgi:GNAT superfamily N-acetyltransferase
MPPLSPELEIRRLRTDEVPAATALLGAQLDDHGTPTEREALAEATGELARRPDRGLLLAGVAAGRLVGIAAVSWAWPLERPGQRCAWLEELYVAPAFRGSGVGTRLLRAAIEAATEAGAAAIDLEVVGGHERAARLYRREGFAPLDRTHWMRPLTPPEPAPQPSPPAALEGGCCCAAVRYRARTAPLEVVHCHCATCRRASGAPVVTWATFDAAAFTVTAGRPAELRASPRAVRTFCGACGTALTYRANDRQDRIDVTVASLDSPDAVSPSAHVWWSERLRWLPVADGLPRWPGSGGT